MSQKNISNLKLLTCIGEENGSLITFLNENSQIVYICSTCIGIEIKLCTTALIKKYIFAKQKRPAHTRVTVTKTERILCSLQFCSVPVCTSLKTLK